MGSTGLRPVVSSVTPETLCGKRLGFDDNSSKRASLNKIRRDAEFHPPEAGAITTVEHAKVFSCAFDSNHD
jgi:hypothetical protein